MASLQKAENDYLPCTIVIFTIWKGFRPMLFLWVFSQKSKDVKDNRPNNYIRHTWSKVEITYFVSNIGMRTKQCWYFQTRKIPSNWFCFVCFLVLVWVLSNKYGFVASSISLHLKKKTSYWNWQFAQGLLKRYPCVWITSFAIHWHNCFHL